MTEFWPTLNSVFNGDAEEQKAAYLLSHSNGNLPRNPKFLKTNHTHNKFKHTLEFKELPAVEDAKSIEKDFVMRIQAQIGSRSSDLGFWDTAKIKPTR